MFLPADPIVTMLFVFGYIFLCVIRGVFSSLNNPKMSHEEFAKWYFDLCETNRKKNEGILDEIRYNNWLYEHRPKEE